MKTILLIRHAKSGWANIQESDYEREINNTGKKEALLMSDKLFKKNIIIDAFISSGALRARQTCEIFCNTYGYPLPKVLFSDILYQATPQNITDLICSVNNKTNSVAIFKSYSPNLILGCASEELIVVKSQFLAIDLVINTLLTYSTRLA